MWKVPTQWFKSLTKRPDRRLLVIECGRNGWHLAEVDLQNASEPRTAVVPLPATASPSDPVVTLPDEASLRECLSENRFTAERCVVLVPRSLVAFRTVTIAPVPAEERNSAVALQVELEAMSPMDQLGWNYLCPEATTEAAALHPLVMTASKEKLGAIVRVVEASGFEVAAVVPHPVAFARKIPSLLPNSDVPASLLWHLHEQAGDVELTLSSAAGNLVASSVVAMGAPQGGVVKAEIADRIAARVVGRMKQILAGLPHSGATNDPLPCLIEASESLSDALHRALTKEETQLRPRRIASVEPDLRAVNEVRSTWGTSQPLADLWHPLESQAPRGTQWPRAAALTLAIVALIGGSVQWQNSRLDRQIRQLAEEERSLKRMIERGRTILPQSEQIAAWRINQISVRDDLAGFLERLPSSDQIVLDELSLAGNTTGEIQLRAQGSAVTSEAALEVSEKLHVVPSRYRLQPHPLRQGRRHDGYSTAFEIEATTMATPDE
jgi:hypothetical protein